MKINYGNLDKFIPDTNIGINWMSSLGGTKFYQNKNLISLFEIDNTSLWWWMEFWLYASYVYQDNLDEVIKKFYTVKKLFEQEKPDSITYVNDDSLFSKALELVAERKKIKIIEIKKTSKILQFRMAKCFKKKLFKVFFKMRFLIRRIFWNCIKNEKIENKNKAPVIFIYYNSHEVKKYVNPIIENIDKNKYEIYGIDIALGGFFSLSVVKEKKRDKVINHLLLENYFSKKENYYMKKELKRFRAVYALLKKNKNFTNLFEIDGINIWSLCEPQFSWFFDLRIEDYLMQYFAMRNIINSINPKIAVTPAETSEVDKALFACCIKDEIPTIGIQHGLLNDLRLVKDKEYISINGTKKGYCPIPTITAVYGKDDKDFLIKRGNYPENSVVITGNPRYDKILQIKKNFNKNNTYRKIGLSPYKKTIIYATQPFASYKKREIIINLLSKVINELQDIQFIIKVHPTEEEKLYKKVLKVKNNVAIIKKIDTLELIYSCDSLITVNSTVGLEAMILNKPLIILADLIGEPDFAGYKISGAALVVSKPEELKQKIKDSLYNKRVIDGLAKHRKKYVFKHCYKLDGKASERVVKIIDRLAKK